MKETIKKTTKKGTTRRASRAATTQPTIDERAEAIIKAWKRYDVDTRAAVRLALNNLKFSERKGDEYFPDSPAEASKFTATDAEELRDLVTRAEAGERVTESGAGAECDAVAQTVINLVEMPSIPDFLLDGILQVLHFTSEATGANLWITVEGDDAEPFISADRLARTCDKHDALLLEIERKRDLASLISAVFSHPDTPVELYNNLQDSIGSLEGFKHAHKHPGYVRAILDADREVKNDA